MLYDAMAALDPTTGNPRGFLRLAADARQDSVLFTLDIRSDGWWRDAERFIQQQAPLVLKVSSGCFTANRYLLLGLLMQERSVVERSVVALISICCEGCLAASCQSQ
jgi:hypothetical protein